MKVALNNNLVPRKKRRQLERKLIKAKRNAWHHKEKVRYGIFVFEEKIVLYRFQRLLRHFHLQ